ncbi:MAG: M48 family metallopeptidase [Spirochaetes bacterium]|nr:M48 family metallopeptidase [Spirochaetota bacterium]
MKSKEPVCFENISAEAWEHPADRAALSALKKVPGFTEMIKWLLGYTSEKSFRMLALASAVRCSEKQVPRIYYHLEKAKKILDYQKEVEIYVTLNQKVNAYTIGVKKPYIILNSGLVNTLNDDELPAVIAHELGHIMSGHVLYKTLLWILLNISTLLLKIPLTELTVLGIIAALKEWDRKSELSADRAGLLVVQDKNTSFNLLMKMAGGVDLKEMDLEEFFKQAAEYEEGGDILDSIYKYLNLLWQTHPFPVLRLQELNNWINAGMYDKILSGDYTKGKENTKVLKDLELAAKQYQKDLAKSADPLTKRVNQLGKGLEELGKEFFKQAEDFFQQFTKKDNK